MRASSGMWPWRGRSPRGPPERPATRPPDHPTTNHKHDQAATRNVEDEDEDDEDWDDVRGARIAQEKAAARLLTAAKRAGVPEREWNNLRTDDAAGGVIVRVNGRDVPLTPKEREIVRDAKAQKAEFDRMMPGAGGTGRTGKPSGAVPPRAARPNPVQRKAAPPKAGLPRLPEGVGRSADWSPE